MYRQILMHIDGRPLQQVIWRSNPTDPLVRYTLKTVTYGTASAPYLAIRCIKQIRLGQNFEWGYVNTKCNPADIASRGLLPHLIISCHLWWFGPKFLKEHRNEWSNSQPITSGIACLNAVTRCDLLLFSRFSCLMKLKRVFAYCLRFIGNLKLHNQPQERVHGCLTVTELNLSLERLLKMAQSETLSESIQLLSNNKLLKNNSLIMLNPFLDEKGILRVGGRLKHSQLSFGNKHPILLDGKHPLTRLIIEYEHKNLLHAGPQLLLATIRQNYWPTAGMSAIKRVTRNCVTCFKFKPQTLNNLMSDLPKERVKIACPFYHTGIDYAGPVYLKDKKGRGCKLVKAYICIFVCFTTKAVHCELVTDLTTDAFISMLRRFCARRGKPYCIHSDNATNLIGAEKELKVLYDFLISSTSDIVTICATDNIQWKFIPPNAPHFGGLWEAVVKSCKYHLLRVLGSTHLIYEEFYTLLVQVEAILNSRPLYALSSDPNDLLPLTPSHFLIGKPLTMAPDPDLSTERVNKLSRLQLLQYMQQDFWKAWAREYLATLQKRNKWKVCSASEIKIGALVLIKQDNLPPCKWLTGRIIEVYPGQDGIIRVVLVKTNHGTFKRAISKLCLLPLPT